MVKFLCGRYIFITYTIIIDTQNILYNFCWSLGNAVPISSYEALLYVLQDPTSVNSEGLSKAELGRLVASRWTGENVDDVGKSDKKGHEDELDIPEPAEEAFEDEHDIPEPVEENYAGYHSEVEDDRHKFEDEELSNVSDDEYVDDHEEPDVSYKSDDDRKGDDHSGIVCLYDNNNFYPTVCGYRLSHCM